MWLWVWEGERAHLLGLIYSPPTGMPAPSRLCGPALPAPRCARCARAAAAAAGKGQRPAWHLDCLEVRCVESGEVAYFRCRDWLSAATELLRTLKVLLAVVVCVVGGVGVGGWVGGWVGG